MESNKAYRFGCSGVQYWSVFLPTGTCKVTFCVSLAASETLSGATCNASVPNVQAGTGAELMSVPAQFIHSFTLPCSCMLAFWVVLFFRVTSISNVFLETSGFTYTSSICIWGNANRYTSCQIPLIWYPHMEPPGTIRRPIVELSSNKDWLRTPTSISTVSPGVTLSVMSKLKGRNKSKFSPNFFLLT